MTEINELQKKRAINLIWNGAGDHSFTPDFKSYDMLGNAEIYWNTIIGAVRKHYDYPRLEKIFLGLQQYEDSDLYEGLLWLGLENCVYGREVLQRPALEMLRSEYAQRFIEEFKKPDDLQIYDTIALAHYQRVLGIDPELDSYSRSLLDELEFSPELDTEEIAEKAEIMFKRWFQIVAQEKKRQKKATVLGLKKRKEKGKGRYHRFGLGFADHPDNIYSGGEQGEQEERQITSKLSAAELRAFMESKYGMPVYPPQKMLEFERAICTGNHSICHLHYTKGVSVKGKIQNGFEALQKEKERVQIQKNRDFFQSKLAENRTVISKLSGRIQNSVLLHLQPAPVKANSGSINSALAWRAAKLDDEHVFTRTEQDNLGNLSVDILLDASTSQKYRQEIVSNQGYMIAESLTRCGIPCRVCSFCSMTGYTILRVFRDYNETKNNDKIFEYVSNGCNRDGLAIRTLTHLMEQENYEHRLLIILSDVKPNDVCRITNDQGQLIAYENEAGLTDTAYEVRRARAEGIAVICVFTGEDEDLPSAKLVYGRDFVRIPSLDMMADTVGKLIQDQIKLI